MWSYITANNAGEIYKYIKTQSIYHLDISAHTIFSILSIVRAALLRMYTTMTRQLFSLFWARLYGCDQIKRGSHLHVYNGAMYTQGPIAQWRRPAVIGGCRSATSYIHRAKVKQTQHSRHSMYIYNIIRLTHFRPVCLTPSNPINRVNNNRQSEKVMHNGSSVHLKENNISKHALSYNKFI